MSSREGSFLPTNERLLELVQRFMPQLQRRTNPTLNQTALMQRVAKKINAAAERMGAMPATGTQAVLRCNGKVLFKDNSEVENTYVN